LASAGWLATDMYVIQLDRNNVPLKTYKFSDAWPNKIGTISLDWKNPEVESFSVTFSYQHFEETASALNLAAL